MPAAGGQWVGVPRERASFAECERGRRGRRVRRLVPPPHSPCARSKSPPLPSAHPVHAQCRLSCSAFSPRARGAKGHGSCGRRLGLDGGAQGTWACGRWGHRWSPVESRPCVCLNLEFQHGKKQSRTWKFDFERVSLLLALSAHGAKSNLEVCPLGGGVMGRLSTSLAIPRLSLSVPRTLHTAV